MRAWAVDALYNSSLPPANALIRSRPPADDPILRVVCYDPFVVLYNLVFAMPSLAI